MSCDQAMMCEMDSDFKRHFESLTDFFFGELLPNEHAAISYNAEDTYFLRMNHAQVRQNGFVRQAEISVTLYKNKRTYSFVQGLSGLFEQDREPLAAALENARSIIAQLPEDPYQSIPTADDDSETIYDGALLPYGTIEKSLLEPAAGLDFAGLLSQGLICRGAANTAGARHWFQTKTFTLDYSIWLKNGRAVKGLYAGRDWQQAEYEKRIADARQRLPVLALEPKKIEPGKYRVFITADALVDVVEFFSWDGFGERGMQQGESAYLALKEGREHFADTFNLTQDFSIGVEPAFNSEGESAPEKLTVIEKGKLVNTIVSSRSEKQYGTKANGAEQSEGFRSAVISAGTLAEAEALKELGTGIYISNFHYLNWSDPASARVTGMTRFACLWVENGKVVAPIADMRWDESLYNLFGANLIALTKERKLFVETSTYEERAVGGCLLPGILVKDFNCTL